MNDRISLKLSLQSYQRFEQLHQQFNSTHSQSLAQPLGAVLADISVEIIEQVFGEIARASTSNDQESEKVLQQILATLRKYMPWSVSLLGNERLTPILCTALVNPFPWGKFIDPEEFIIMAQSRFVETEDLAKIRAIVGNVKSEEGSRFYRI